ncbi:MAG: aldehyde ferredoxin oxidoreductase family protein [Candidatus Thorarchaeota archaeon]
MTDEWYGWAGTILRVDLTKGTIKKVPLDKDLAYNYVGGRGFNSKILFDEVKPGTDPFGPDNLLIFSTGPCTGTSIPNNGRYTVSTLSWVTGGLGDANSGGYFGQAMKYAGYDAIIVKGVSKKPVYLFIEDDTVELRDASHLWGKDVWETTEILMRDHSNKGMSVAAIGQAGENMVAAAAIMNDYSRAAAKAGVGAIMGSKKLKAISAYGESGIRVYDPEEVYKSTIEYIELIAKTDKWWFETFSKYGTPMFVDQYQHLGALPTYNWKEGTFEHADKLGITPLYEKYVKKKRGCGGCMYHCSPWFRIDEGPFKGWVGEGVEYEAMTGFGSKLGCDNLEVALVGGSLCDMYGLDYISAAEVMGWAWECYNEGILTKEDTDGLDLSWGNDSVIHEVLRRLANREGKLGELLALGSRKASERIGGKAKYFSMTIKGQQMGSMDPRVLKAWGFGYGVATRGGDHLRTHLVCEYMFTPEEMEKYVGDARASDRFTITEAKADLVRWTENVRFLNDALETCKYINRGSPRSYVEFPYRWLTATTGKSYTYEGLQTVADRVLTIERAFNVARGMSRKDDYLPDRYYDETLSTGTGKGQRVSRELYDKLLDRYYEIRGWDKEGRPKRSHLEKVGLKYVADELEKLGFLGKEAS